MTKEEKATPVVDSEEASRCNFRDAPRSKLSGERTAVNKCGREISVVPNQLSILRSETGGKSCWT